MEHFNSLRNLMLLKISILHTIFSRNTTEINSKKLINSITVFNRIKFTTLIHLCFISYKMIFLLVLIQLLVLQLKLAGTTVYLYTKPRAISDP